MAFALATQDQAYLKAGFLGLQGSGKTYTATKVAIGLHQRLTKLNVSGGGNTPIFMADTETGSSWIKRLCDEAGIALMADKTKSFAQLCKDIDEVEAVKGILVIDSITHYWKALVNRYMEQKKRTYLTFQDWTIIKNMWEREFTTRYINSACHILMCGRQGYEYDTRVGEDGKKEIEKVAIKMKAEAETGYEPSILIAMERHQKMSGNAIEKVWREAYILKDRSSKIDGKSFVDPTFDSFLPHIESLNLGGEHVGVTTDDTALNLPKDGDTFAYEVEQCKIELEEIEELLKKHYPSMSADDKAAKAATIDEFFGTRSWTKISKLGLNELKHGHNRIHNKLEGKPKYQHMSLEDGKFTTESPF